MVGYDQLQEDLGAARLRISQQDARIDAQDLRRLEDERRHAEEITRLDRRLRYAEGIVRHLNDEVDEVRALYRTAQESGKWPTLPPRQPWPAYPGEWQEAIK
jgi:tRNA(Glu) U13 pseudouridine synthase TruD